MLKKCQTAIIFSTPHIHPVNFETQEGNKTEQKIELAYRALAVLMV